MSDHRREAEQVAAGGVVVERGQAGAARVLVVHRPRYDDWSLPKGKAEQGETLEQTALREVKEETGLDCRVVRKLAAVRYVFTRKGRPVSKLVHYFLMDPVGGQVQVNGEEVDAAEWVGLDEAAARLSYDHDRQLLESLAS